MKTHIVFLSSLLFLFVLAFCSNSREKAEKTSGILMTRMLNNQKSR